MSWLPVAAALVASGVVAADAEAPAAPGGATSRIQGTAMRDRRHPVIGATAGLTVEGSASPLRLTSTDDRGVFRFDGLGDGSYRLELRRDGYLPVVKDRIEVRFPYRAVLEITMLPMEPPPPGASHGGAVPAEPAWAIRGVVETREEKPVPEARVHAARVDGTIDPRSVLTAGDGTFDLEGLPEGPWRVEILGAGYLPVRTDVDLRGNLEVRAFLVGQPADYVPPPADLLPPEIPIPPPGW